MRSPRLRPLLHENDPGGVDEYVPSSESLVDKHYRRRHARRSCPRSTFDLIERARAGRQGLARAPDGATSSALCAAWSAAGCPRGPATWPTRTTLSRTLCFGRFQRSRASSLRGVGALQAYLRQAVMNRLRDELRRKGRAPCSSRRQARLRGRGLAARRSDRTRGLRAVRGGAGAARPDEREAIIGRVEMEYSLRRARRDARQADAGRGAQGRAARAAAPGRGNETMRPSDDLLDEVADAILDGTPIDWRGIDSSADQAPAADRAAQDAGDVAACAGERLDEPAIRRAPAWGHLRVFERIGQGAFGDVYRAWDTRLDREVALKLLPADVRCRPNRPATSIIEEGRLLAASAIRTSSPSTAPNGSTAAIGLWMEFVKGPTLEQALRDGSDVHGDRTSHASASSCAAPCRRSMRPACCTAISRRRTSWLADDGRLVLMDFGTGRELRRRRRRTSRERRCIWRRRCCPAARRPLQSDVYSIGVLLYHLLTGSYPVRAATSPPSARACGRRRTDLRSARPDDSGAAPRESSSAPSIRTRTAAMRQRGVARLQRSRRRGRRRRSGGRRTRPRLPCARRDGHGSPG